jgi:alkanesulfonate monooxygenase SsuD/methylene tetrahydromethanopterin reductase-like flavin-dependent oxidoreductase (luciferase family)
MSQWETRPARHGVRLCGVPIGRTGLILPTFPQTSAPRWVDGGRDGGWAGGSLADLAKRAEAAGAGSLWATDHLFWHGPCLECLVALTIIASATDHVGVGSCVIQLPLRRPGEVAKQASAIQALSGGRFILGVGVGSHVGEYEQVGAAYHSRGRELDLGIAELHRSWNTAGLGNDDDYTMLPTCWPVPVWAGGSSRAALVRAARVGDGWMPLFVDPEDYRAACDTLSDEIATAGRSPDAVSRAMVLFISIDDDPGVAMSRGLAWMSSMYNVPTKAFSRRLVAGTAEQVADQVSTWRDAGAEHVVVYVTDDDPIDQFRLLIETETKYLQGAVEREG